MLNSSFHASSTPPLRRRRRVSLACTSCRQKKTRCNGERPSCSPCLDLRVHCVYEEASREYRSPRGIELKYGQVHPRVINRRRINDEDPEIEQLKCRIRELEAKLQSISAASPDTWSKDKSIPPQMTDLADSAIRSRGPNDSSSTAIEQGTDDAGVDTLATTTFNDSADGTYRDVGCFGPTSNHALFRNLSDIFTHLVDVNSPPKQQHSLATSLRVNGSAGPAPISVPVKGSQCSEDVSEIINPYALPNYQKMETLLNKFSATVGVVLPFVNTTKLLNDYHREQEHKRLLPRPTRALLNIICAYASSTLRNADSRVYYRRALALMDEKTLRGSSLELIQALLLIGSFEQNNQCSVASWTLHAVAVKTAFQQGLHSRSHYKHHTLEDKELRKRIWYAVVNQDRHLSISLGRPCMVPQQHIHVERPRNPTSITQTMPLTASEDIISLLYFDRIISVDTIKCSIIDSLYSHNIDLELLTTQDLILKRLQLSWELEQWRQDTSVFCEILSASKISQWSSGCYSANRLQVLLSIQYYSVMLLINGPLLTRFLVELAEEKQSTKDNAIQTQIIISVIKQDFENLNDLSTIVHGAVNCGEAFLESNAAWWKCNYIMFTVNLHLFAILLICRCSGTVLAESGIGMAHVRSALDRSLNILRGFEKSSLMSRKACHCMSRFLKVFDSLASEQLPIAPLNATREGELAVDVTLGTSWIMPEDISTMPESFFSQYVAQSADEFLFQCSDTAFLDADMDLLWDNNQAI